MKAQEGEFKLRAVNSVKKPKRRPRSVLRAQKKRNRGRNAALRRAVPRDQRSKARGRIRKGGNRKSKKEPPRRAFIPLVEGDKKFARRVVSRGKRSSKGREGGNEEKEKDRTEARTQLHFFPAYEGKRKRHAEQRAGRFRTKEAGEKWKRKERVFYQASSDS